MCTYFNGASNVAQPGGLAYIYIYIYREREREREVQDTPSVILQELHPFKL